MKRNATDVQEYTLIIPTFNRPSLLHALLSMLAETGAAFPVIVLDSSAPETCKRNRQTISDIPLDVRHLEFPEDVEFLTKLQAGLDKVATEFVSFCADDDIVFVDAIVACLEYLKHAPDYVACHGTYLNFSLAGKAMPVGIEYNGASIDAPGEVGRIFQLLSHYEAVFYALYRTPALREVIRWTNQPDPSTMWRFHFFELFSAVLTAAIGKIKRLEVVSNGRRSAPSPQMQWHPVTLLTDDPDGYLTEFVAYRQRLILYLNSNGVSLDKEAEYRITLAHLYYFLKSVAGDYVPHRIEGIFAESLPPPQPLPVPQSPEPQAAAPVEPAARPAFEKVRMAWRLGTDLARCWLGIRSRHHETRDLPQPDQHAQQEHEPEGDFEVRAPETVRPYLSAKTVDELLIYFRSLPPE